MDSSNLAGPHSERMRRVGSKNTAPEMIVRQMLHRLGYRYVLHDRRLPGQPDLVFPSRGKVVFVHGCFWHGHDCRRGTRPKSNAVFWATKIEGNKVRDTRHLRTLRALGWRVLVVWECATKPTRLAGLQSRLVRFLEGR